MDATIHTVPIASVVIHIYYHVHSSSIMIKMISNQLTATAVKQASLGVMKTHYWHRILVHHMVATYQLSLHEMWNCKHLSILRHKKMYYPISLQINEMHQLN